MSPDAAAAVLAAATTSHDLPGVFGSLEPTLRHYGYLAVGGVIFLEDFGVPLPGETMLIAASLYAGTGHLSIWLVGVVALLAAVLGDNVGFAIGRVGGRRLVDRFGRYILLTARRVERIERFFTDHGAWIVVVARFVEGLRQANGIVAGMVEMPWRRFLAANALGAALWVATWTSLGYLAGDHVETVTRYFTDGAIAVAALVVVVVAVHLVRLRRRRRRPPVG